MSQTYDAEFAAAIRHCVSLVHGIRARSWKENLIQGISLWSLAGLDRARREKTTERTWSRIPHIGTGARKLSPVRQIQGFPSSLTGESADFRNSDT
jgi:hypothetical protein